MILYICGLLGYWESIVIHKFKMVIEDNKLKPLPCKVKNNMETTLHMNEFKFHKPGKCRNNKNLLQD